MEVKNENTVGEVSEVLKKETKCVYPAIHNVQ